MPQSGARHMHSNGPELGSCWCAILLALQLPGYQPQVLDMIRSSELTGSIQHAAIIDDAKRRRKKVIAFCNVRSLTRTYDYTCSMQHHIVEAVNCPMIDGRPAGTSEQNLKKPINTREEYRLFGREKQLHIALSKKKNEKQSCWIE
jgi:hypothetical protein